MCNCGSGFTDTTSGCTGIFSAVCMLMCVLTCGHCHAHVVRCASGCVHGTCVGIDNCDCDDGWRGNTCNERMAPL